MSLEDDWNEATPIPPRRAAAAAPSGSGPTLTDVVTGRAPKRPPTTEEAPGAVETFVRNASNAVSSNLVNPLSARIASVISGQPYDEALRGINETDEAGAQANPKAATAGTATGIGLQLAAPVPKLGPTASLGARIGHSAAVGAGYGALGGAGEALNEGGDLGDALIGAGRGGAIGGATGGVLGGVVGKLFRGAPERVAARLQKDITRGEAGGTAAAKFGNKVADSAADEVSQALDAAGPGVRKVVSANAGSAPAKAQKAIQAALERNTNKVLTPIYAAIDAGPAVPEALNVKLGIAELADKLRSEGQAQVAEHVDRYANFLDKHYEDGKKLTASMIRKLRNEVGTGNAFPTDEIARSQPGVLAKQAIYHALNGTIEKAASETPGVDVAALKAGNKFAADLIPLSQSLADRAAKAKRGASTLTHAVAASVGLGEIGHIAAQGMSTGNIAKAASEIAAIYAARHVAPAISRTGRKLDYIIAEAEQAARAGGANAKMVRAIGEAIASRIGGAAVRAKLEGGDSDEGGQ